MSSGVRKGEKGAERSTRDVAGALRKHGASSGSVLDYPSRDSTGISKAYEPATSGRIGTDYRFPFPNPTADS